MKKKMIYLVLITIILILTIIIFQDLSKTKTYDISLRAEIMSNSRNELLIKGFPDNRKGQTGQYIIRNNSQINVFDNQDNVIDFSNLKTGDIITIWYSWKIPADEIDNIEELLLLDDNKNIPNVSSIKINEE
ncbi:MAG: hypothetical protein QM657_16550 [Lacrimispora sp.]|uniref:hypothetical protein n=1 Tax=Lacrimispora sp. TaxID=2719234 RepID=UPI0039E475FB